jgi:site-specific recombinase XerD
MKNLRKRVDQNNLYEINDLITRFDNYLNIERGLVKKTRDVYCSCVRVFLHTKFASPKNRIKDFSPKDVYQFVLSYSQQGKSGRTLLMIGSLRAFFRFLELFDLADSLPSVPHHKPTLQEYLSYTQLQALLEAYNRNTMKGLRDYTIVMLLIHLGLRRSEVSRLALNDFDWNNGEIIIRGKGSTSRMPISQKLGDALVDYLKRGRPICYSKFFFTRLQHPFSGLSSNTISCIVRAGLQRAGLNTKHQGAHLLRHSFATQLFAKGKSLPEISMVLRHKNIRTTAIYVHVDSVKLRLVALPWPISKSEVDHE